MENAVVGVQLLINYNFNDNRLLWLALQAAGSGYGGPDGNKLLAMVGNAALELILVNELSQTGGSRGMLKPIEPMRSHN